MELKELYTNLCWYDPRNPNGEKDPDVIAGHEQEVKKRKRLNLSDCSCDNCFYGRAALANQLIKNIEVVQAFLREHDVSTGGTIAPPTDKEIQAFREIAN